jgi:hypothetical protein
MMPGRKYRPIGGKDDPARIAAADELAHARRMVFWGTFLAIPEIFLEFLPFKLFPPARNGHWPVHWWHRAYWHTGRRLLEVPVRAGGPGSAGATASGCCCPARPRAGFVPMTCSTFG